MDCHEFLHRYSEYDDSLIPVREAGRFREHMAGCPACARYDRVLRKGRMLARQLADVEPSADFMPRLRIRLLRAGRRDRAGAARVAAGLAAATILVVSASAVGLLAPDTRSGRQPDAAPAVRTVLATPAPVRLVGSRRGIDPTPDRVWMAEKVAPADPASYSPLVTGPPAYRTNAPSGHRTTDFDRRALD